MQQYRRDQEVSGGVRSDYREPAGDADPAALDLLFGIPHRPQPVLRDYEVADLARG